MRCPGRHSNRLPDRNGQQLPSKEKLRQLPNEDRHSPGAAGAAAVSHGLSRVLESSIDPGVKNKHSPPTGVQANPPGCWERPGVDHWAPSPWPLSRGRAPSHGQGQWCPRGAAALHAGAPTGAWHLAAVFARFPCLPLQDAGIFSPACWRPALLGTVPQASCPRTDGVFLLVGALASRPWDPGPTSTVMTRRPPLGAGPLALSGARRW